MASIKKSQMWSYDIIAAVTVFVFSFIIFYTILTGAPSTEKTSQLSDEGGHVSSVAKSSETEGNLSFVKGGVLRERDLKKFAEKDYTDLRRELGISQDFCIHFEDEEGNLLNISGITSIGSSRINLTSDDESNICGQT